MTDTINFSAGPAVLPEAVLRRAREELLDWQGSGMSVLEMSHRGEHFVSIAERAEADLRQLLSIPDEYRVLFLQGGATLQFSMVPMNLSEGQKAAYIDTGSWSRKAIAEARRYCSVDVVASTEASNYTCVPAADSIAVESGHRYLHYCANETIGGVEFHTVPDAGEIPLVSDMSSTLLSRPLDVSRFGLIYAGAQKNLGPAGVTIVIVREDLLGLAGPTTPAMLNYDVHAKAGSMSNTPPTFAWYLTGLVFQWIADLGGLEKMGQINFAKATKLYQVIDESDFYHNPVRADCRSWMNIPFTLASADLDEDFLSGAKERGMVSLKGHRSVGGMRASVYNAMPEEGIDRLIDYMREFEAEHG